MTYQESLDFIHGIQRFGSKPGLRRVRLLLERMGNPQKKLRFVHVAGTNGKGSTCTMLSHIFTQAGHRTGLYISPFVIDFRERIQLNNEMIPPGELARSTAAIKVHWDALEAMGEPPTEFEVVVAVAIDYFVRQGCDLVVWEVGMGGRFDATNIIDTPLASVITSISIDHTQYLGDTIEQIAAEKCGIIKPGGTTVSYPRQHPAALAVIMEACAKNQNRLLMATGVQVLESSALGSRIRVEDVEIVIPLTGEHQIWNTLTVLETVKAVRLSGVSVPDEAVVRGIAAARPPARLERLGENPLILLDGAHNPDGIAALGKALDALGDRSVHAVCAIMADKDVERCLSEIAPRCASLTATAPAGQPRAVPPEELAKRAGRYCRGVSASVDAGTAFREAYTRCKHPDVLLVWGSFYLAAEVRPLALNAVEIGIKQKD